MLFDSIVAGITTEKFHFYSTYSMTLLGILHAIDSIRDPTYFPTFASTIIFELHEIEEEFFVKVLNND